MPGKWCPNAIAVNNVPMQRHRKRITVNVPVHRIRRRKDTTIIAATTAHDATVIGNIRVTGHSMPIMVTSMPAPASAFA